MQTGEQAAKVLKIGIAAIILMVAAYLALKFAPDPAPLAQIQAPAPVPAPAAGQTLDAASRWVAKPAAQPVQSGGVFQLDSAGNLIADPASRARIDILVSELPENPDRVQMRMAEEKVAAGLPPAAATVAVGILHGYLSYMKALMAQQPGANAEQNLDNMIALRRTHLGKTVADGFFGADEAQARHGIKATAIEADPRLSAQEKATRLDALQRSLPQGGGAAPAPRSSLQMEAEVAAMRARGGGERDVALLRRKYVGGEGAAAIAEMEAGQRDWQQRIDAFVRRRAELRQRESGDRLAQQSGQLLRRYFAEEEMGAALAYADSNR